MTGEVPRALHSSQHKREESRHVPFVCGQVAASGDKISVNSLL